MKRTSILFILPFFPYPLESGGHQALFNGIAAVKDDFDVYIAYEAINDSNYHKAVNDFLKAIPSAILYPLLHNPAPNPPLWIRLAYKLKILLKKALGIKDDIVDLGQNKDEIMCKWWLRTVTPLRKEWLEHISTLCSTHHFDIIQVEMPWFVSQILTLPKSSKRLFVHHEIGFVKRELEISNTHNSDYVKACKLFADHNEITLLNMYDAVISLSAPDAEKMKRNGVKVPVFPSFAVIDSSADLREHRCNGKRLAFVGPDNHSPNFIGITWFLENCWQRLKEKDQDYKLDIIGKWSQSRIEEIKQKYQDVNFLGFVDDLGTALKGSIMIVPITIGSGIRMKILEASSKGIPFVSTTVGAEGIPVISGKHCFIADTPEKFIDDILKLQDEELQKQFVVNANKMVKENYSIDALRENRMAIYKKVL